MLRILLRLLRTRLEGCISFSFSPCYLASFFVFWRLMVVIPNEAPEAKKKCRKKSRKTQKLLAQRLSSLAFASCPADFQRYGVCQVSYIFPMISFGPCLTLRRVSRHSHSWPATYTHARKPNTSARTSRPVAWLVPLQRGLSLRFPRSTQSVPSLLLPTDGDAPLVYPGLTVALLPKVAFFAWWVAREVCMGAGQGRADGGREAVSERQQVFPARHAGKRGWAPRC